MQKNYLEISNFNTSTASLQLSLDIDEALLNKKVNSEKYGAGKIISTEISFSDQYAEPQVQAKISFKDDVEKKFNLNFALENNILSVDDETLQIINDAISESKKIKTQVEKNIKKQKDDEDKIKAQELKEQKEKERIEKAKLKAEQMKKSQLHTVKQFGKNKILVNDNYYVGLGYIAKHVRRIVADMPDYLESWFIKTFGNQEHKAHDQTILCPSGLPSHYALGFRIDLDTNEGIPSSLVKHLSEQNKTNKPIADTSFIYEIMYNYGFQFGKTQDIDKIRKSIPADQLSNFELGYNA